MVDWESFHASFRRPDFIRGYEIQQHLGGGAFGEVYKARKTSIGKFYAIKFLCLDNEGGRGAIERELDSVRLFASIEHPNLVTIEDMGVVESVAYVIMGFAGKETLAGRLEARELDTSSALRYFVQACRGVLVLHDRRLAHFDLNPSSIFLRGNVARVGGYGLAQLLGEARRTPPFGRGTPRYRAPEMLENHAAHRAAHRADHRADIYSLGVILFECFTYALPYADLGVRGEDAPPEFPVDFPRDLVEVVTRCLRLDPDDRYPSLTELLGALGQTARQGDSVRLKVSELSRETRALQAAEEPLTPAGRLQRSKREGCASEDHSRRAARGSAGAEVVSFSTLDEPDEPDDSTPEELEQAAWREELDRSRRERSGVWEPVLAAGRPTTFATVPVPPPAEGGWVGSILQSIIVGVEIMGALVTGPVLVGLRGTTLLQDRILRGVPRPLEKRLRVILMLGVLALLGALAVAVFLNRPG